MESCYLVNLLLMGCGQISLCCDQHVRYFVGMHSLSIYMLHAISWKYCNNDLKQSHLFLNQCPWGMAHEGDTIWIFYISAHEKLEVAIFFLFLVVVSNFLKVVWLTWLMHCWPSYNNDSIKFYGTHGKASSWPRSGDCVAKDCSICMLCPSRK